MANQLIPSHVAIIPDGNRRWAKGKNWITKLGYEKGGERVVEITREAIKWGVQTLTFYLFSTENWRRPRAEIQTLFFLYERMLRMQQKNLVEEGVRFETIGVVEKFPTSLQRMIQQTKEKTKEGRQLSLVAAFNYGGRDELVRAIQKIVSSEQKVEEINEELVGRYLDTAPFGDPDLVIRTSGENRLSNFLTWQAAYSELYIADVHWPEFSAQHFSDALQEYQARRRRYGR